MLSTSVLPPSSKKEILFCFTFSQPVLVFSYGRLEDIQKLKELGVSLEGKIAISRYGKIFRGNRLKNCQAAGAVGVIMYTDPAQVAPRGTDPESVYPNTFFLPPSGVQRGTTFIDADPLSPSWPSVDGAYRLTLNETTGESGLDQNIFRREIFPFQASLRSPPNPSATVTRSSCWPLLADRRCRRTGEEQSPASPTGWVPALTRSTPAGR